jgi:hypothetical protein
MKKLTLKIIALILLVGIVNLHAWAQAPSRDSTRMPGMIGGLANPQSQSGTTVPPGGLALGVKAKSANAASGGAIEVHAVISIARNIKNPDNVKSLNFTPKNPIFDISLVHIRKQFGKSLTYRLVGNNIAPALEEYNTKLAAIGQSSGSSKTTFHNVMLGVFYRLGNNKLKTDIGLNAGISIKRGGDYSYSATYNSTTPPVYTQVLAPKQAVKKAGLVAAPLLRFNYSVSNRVALQLSTAYTFALSNNTTTFTGADLSAVQQTTDVALLRQQLKGAQNKDLKVTYGNGGVQVGVGVVVRINKHTPLLLKK